MLLDNIKLKLDAVLFVSRWPVTTLPFRTRGIRVERGRIVANRHFREGCTSSRRICFDYRLDIQHRYILYFARVVQ